MHTPVNQILLYKSGVEGGQNYIGMFSWCFFFFNTLLIWLPWRTKIKSVLNRLKVYKKHSCSIFFFFCLFLFCYCLVWYWSIGKTNQLIWAYNIAMLLLCVLRQKALLPRSSKLLPISQEGEVTSPLISGPAWTCRLQFTKYNRDRPQCNFLYFFFVIPLTVYIRSTELCRSQFMCYILLLATGI